MYTVFFFLHQRRMAWPIDLQYNGDNLKSHVYFMSLLLAICFHVSLLLIHHTYSILMCVLFKQQKKLVHKT